METLINKYFTFQDYRGYPLSVGLRYHDNLPLSDEILRMKNVRFFFQYQSKPIHKLVSPEPHFVKEERNLLENHFSYLISSNRTDDIEEQKCFEMDCEGHLVTMNSYQAAFQLSNETIEHLSNFPHLRDLQFGTYHVKERENVINLSLLSNLRKLEISFQIQFEDPELLQDLGLFTNLIFLYLENEVQGNY